MTNQETIANLNMISVAFVDSVTKEQRKLIDDTFDNAIKALEQEPKTGHWIDNPVRKNLCNCSECNGLNNVYSAFCPNCGAKMVEPQEGSDKE